MSSPIVIPVTNSSIIFNTTIAKAAVTQTTSHVLTNGGTIYSWGSVSFTTIFDGLADVIINSLGFSSLRVSSPTIINVKNEFFIDICAGFAHVAAITQSNKLYFWGTIITQGGKILMNSTLPITLSLSVLGGNTVTKVFCTHSSIIILDNGSNLYSVGRNITLGTGSVTDSTTLVKITFFTGTPTITTVSGSFHTVLVKRSDGSLVTWGSNSNKQIGDNVSPNP